METGSDLIWLVQTGGTFPALVEKTPRHVTVDMAAETWIYNDQTFKFGRAVERLWEMETVAPLGAYNRQDCSHLRQMVTDYRRLVIR